MLSIAPDPVTRNFARDTRTAQAVSILASSAATDVVSFRTLLASLLALGLPCALALKARPLQTQIFLRDHLHAAGPDSCSLETPL